VVGAGKAGGVKHDELQEDLAGHLRGGSDRLVWTNTQLGPSGSPRPDVFTVNKSFSRFRTDCYEVKVSVSDLRHDVTSGKWQSYRKFGHAVWFAFPRGLASLDLVPKECGVILRGDAGWRSARKPVAQVLDTLPRDTWLKLLMTDAEGTSQPGPRHMSEWKAEEIARRKFGDQFAQLIRDRARAEHRFESYTKALEEHAEKLAAEVKQRRDDALECAKREEAYLNSAMQELGVELGLEWGKVTASELSSAIRRTRAKLRGANFQGAIETLQFLAGALKEEETA
jgi:hypothetical protein